MGHNKNSLSLFHNIWDPAGNYLVARVWNHLEMTSLTGLVTDIGSKLSPHQDLSWGSQLKKPPEPVRVALASRQHGGPRVVSLLIQ